MGIMTLVLLSLGLAMDATAVSISNGICFSNVRKKEAIFTAFLFGAFQAGMPIIGYFAGRSFSEQISALDHWIAVILLGIIGGKMIIEAIRELKSGECCSTEKTLMPRAMVMQAIATSIDALAVGISFAVMRVNIWQAALAIGAITFVCSLLGTQLGKKFGMLLKQKAEIFGGVILVGIGLKIFIEHMFMS